MPTFLRSVVFETLEAPLESGTQVRSVAIETLEAPLESGTQVRSVVIEVLEKTYLASYSRDFYPQENLKYHKNVQGSILKSKIGQL